MINGNWQATRGGFVAQFPGDLQAEVTHVVGPISECWVWQVGHDDIEAHGESPNGTEALEAAQRAVAKMEAEREKD